MISNNGVLIFCLAMILCSACGKKQNSKSVQPVQHEEYLEIIKNPLSASNQANNAKAAEITFDESSYFFGQVVEGDTVEHEFQFQNTGDQLLLITEARSSCGCTVPTIPEDPIKPGEKGSIRVVFDTKGKEGKQVKTVTILANTIPHSTPIKLAGEVLKNIE